MKKFKIIFFALIVCLALAGCKKEKIVKYNVTVISQNHREIYEKYSRRRGETDKYLLSSDGSILTDVSAMDNREIQSVKVFRDSYNPEDCRRLIEKCKSGNIPMIFLGGSVDKEILAEYDKAFSVTLDYAYLGEEFATYIHSVWTEQIHDRNGDKIFAFSVILPENITREMQTYRDILIHYIELLGVPMQKNDEVSGSPEEMLQFCKDTKAENEAFIVIDSLCLPAIIEGYPPYGESIEILGVDFGFENRYAGDPNMKVCFVNYADYFDAAGQILTNIEAKTYPFENLSYNFIDKTVYLRPVV